MMMTTMVVVTKRNMRNTHFLPVHFQRASIPVVCVAMINFIDWFNSLVTMYRTDPNGSV